MWCDDGVDLTAAYSQLGSGSTLNTQAEPEPKQANPIGFIWPEKEKESG
jgi:hypothetical protein